MIDELRPKLSRLPRLPRLLTVPPAIRIGGRMSQERLRIHAAGSRHRGAVHARRRSWRRTWRSCPIFRTSPPTCRSRIPRVNVEIDRDQAAASGSERQRRSRRRCTTPSARSWSSTIYAPTNQYQRAAGDSTQVSAATPTTCRRSTSNRRPAALVPLNAVRETHAKTPARRASTTPASCRPSLSRST